MENKKKNKRIFGRRNGETTLICPGCGYENILIEMKWDKGITKCKKCEWRFRFVY